MVSSEPKDVVRRGYDAASYQYRSDEASPDRYAPWIAAFQQHLPDDAVVLDLGCGCGIPVASTLSNAGHHVTGIDLSPVQIRRARQLVPQARFLQADVSSLAFPACSFDAVVGFYVLIHLPLDEQRGLLGRIAAWLRPGG